MILQEIFWFVYPCILFYLWRCLQEYENYPTLETLSPNCATLVEFCQQKSVVYPNSWFMMFHFFQQPSVNWPWRCTYFIIHFWGCHNFSFVLKKRSIFVCRKGKFYAKRHFGDLVHGASITKRHLSNIHSLLQLYERSHPPPWVDVISEGLF